MNIDGTKLKCPVHRSVRQVETLCRDLKATFYPFLGMVVQKKGSKISTNINFSLAISIPGGVLGWIWVQHHNMENPTKALHPADWRFEKEKQSASFPTSWVFSLVSSSCWFGGLWSMWIVMIWIYLGENVIIFRQIKTSFLGGFPVLSMHLCWKCVTMRSHHYTSLIHLDQYKTLWILQIKSRF